MLTWRTWLKLVQSLNASDQIKLLIRIGTTFIAFSLILSLNYRANPIAMSETFIRAPARVISKAETWPSRRSLYSFGVIYQTSDGRQHNAEIYAENYTMKRQALM